MMQKVGLNNIHKKNQLDYLYVQLEFLTIKSEVKNKFYPADTFTNNFT
jgi:hypothetical protein